MIGRFLSPISAALIVFSMSAAAAPALAAPAPPARTAAAAVPTLANVHSVADLEALFAADRGKYRLVLLLSPT